MKSKLDKREFVSLQQNKELKDILYFVEPIFYISLLEILIIHQQLIFQTSQKNLKLIFSMKKYINFNSKISNNSLQERSILYEIKRTNLIWISLFSSFFKGTISKILSIKMEKK